MADQQTDAERPLSSLSVNALAAAWGFGEATLFFLVPDVFLTWVAVRSPKSAFIACGFALLGALLGGIVIYVWGSYDLVGALAVLKKLPAIDAAMCQSVGDEMRAEGVWATLQGPGEGRPYKIYAVWAGALDLSLTGFLLISIPARLIRFVLVTALVAGIARGLYFLSLSTRQLIHLGSWTIFYAWYFWTMGV